MKHVIKKNEAKPSPEPILIYWQFDPCQQTPVKSKSKLQKFSFKELNVKCHQLSSPAAEVRLYSEPVSITKEKLAKYAARFHSDISLRTPAIWIN